MECFNTGDKYQSWCEHTDHYQEGGGLYKYSWIFCNALRERILLEPPIPQPGQKFHCLIPATCPMRIAEEISNKKPKQLSLFQAAAQQRFHRTGEAGQMKMLLQTE